MILEFYSEIADNCWFESAVLILTKYIWNYTLNKKQTKIIEKIKSAVFEMQDCLKDSNKWHKISKIAYKIHNERGEFMDKQLQ